MNKLLRIRLYLITTVFAVIAGLLPAAASASGSSASTPANTTAPTTTSTSRRTTAADQSTDTAQVASKQAGTSSIASDAIPGLDKNLTNAGTAASGLDWWFWPLIGLTIFGVIYYLVEDRIRAKLEK